ncbi:ECF transporter S component [Veillonella criceti]|uniref:Pantothenic acid ECF transporter S component PanT n=1 Tax=Veillonella criceti TaxID=103891 RepID=A0A380NIE8_9FIRM|nr:ECF transporter S component [Veillonella criceti]SUP40209.1 Pantothenic acid ECF transporter S component PanT [Veillonella criceti]
MSKINNETTSDTNKPVKNPYAKQRFSLRQLTVIGLLSALTVVLGVTGLGFIPIPPINATILHIPTLIGALLEGPKIGMVIGFIFGCYSLVQNMIQPNIMSFVFLNPIVSVLPRMLIGPLSYLVYRYLPFKRPVWRVMLALFMGTMIHTILVMGLIYIIYAEPYAAAKGIPVENVANIVIGVAVFHGPLEALAAVVVGTPVVMALRAKLKKA